MTITLSTSRQVVSLTHGQSTIQLYGVGVATLTTYVPGSVDYITSNPGVGEKKITGLRLSADNKIIVTYEE